METSDPAGIRNRQPDPPVAGELHLATSSQRIPELDGLRGLAILLVLLCHYVANAGHAGLGFYFHRFLQAFAFGWSGVDLFFVLSGFLIGGILLELKDSARFFQAFYLRRVHRILPIYYSWILLFVVFRFAMTFVFPAWSLLKPDDLSGVPIYFVFLQNFVFLRPPLDLIWLGVTWSLAVEEQFYLVSPPLIRFLPLRRLTILLMAVIVSVPLLRFFLFRFVPEYSYFVTFAMPCRADALGVGILAAIGWRNVRFRSFLARHPYLLRNVLIILGLGIVPLFWWLVHPVSLVTSTIGYSWLAFFYCSLMLFVLSRTDSIPARFTRLRPLRSLGTISYCIYIIHFTVNQLTHRLLLHSEPQIYNWRGIGTTLLALVLTLAIASLSWVVLEKPMIRRGHRFSY